MFFSQGKWNVVPYLVSASDNDKNVSEISRLNIQLDAVQMDTQVERAHRGKNSEERTHGMGA